MRDAYRVLKGKPPKCYQSVVTAYSPAHRGQLPLTDRDLEFLDQRLDSCGKGSRLLLIGSHEEKVTIAVASKCKDISTTQIILGGIDKSPDGFTRAIMVVAGERWNVVATNDLGSELLKLRKEPPETIVINEKLSDALLNETLRIAREIGVSYVVGWGNEVSMFASMQVVHEYQTSEGTDYLWEARVSEEKRFDAGKPSGQIKAVHSLDEPVPGVSIVIPVYNSVDYLAQTLCDCEKQTYNNWEIVLVDDGSKEPVDGIVEEFKKRWPSKRIVYKKKIRNEGVSAARNTGMALSSGQFIAFLDSDDRWTPNHLSRKLHVLESTKADLVYSAVEMFDDQTDAALYNWGPTPEELEFFPDSLLSRNFIQPSGVVISRGLYEAIGGFNQDISIGEDYDYWLRALKIGSVFTYDPVITTRYRKNHTSAATTNRMVLCYDNVARIASRYSDLIQNENLRKFLIVRHLMTAGLGHMSYSSKENFGSNSTVGRDLIGLASKVDPTNDDVRQWLKVANFAINTKASHFLKPIFRKHFKHYCRQPVSFHEFQKAA